MKRYIRAKIVNLLDEDYDTLRDIALDPNTDHDTLLQLANTTGIAWDVVKNPNLSEDILNVLADNEIRGIRHYVVLHPKVTSEILNKILDIELKSASTGYLSDYVTIFKDIINSPKVTEDMLWKIAKDTTISPYIKTYIYTSPSTTDGLIEYLHNQDIWNDRWKHSNTAVDALNRVANCTWSTVDGYLLAKLIQQYNPYRTPKEIVDYLVGKYDEFKYDYDNILNRLSH